MLWFPECPSVQGNNHILNPCRLVLLELQFKSPRALSHREMSNYFFWTPLWGRPCVGSWESLPLTITETLHVAICRENRVGQAASPAICRPWPGEPPAHEIKCCTSAIHPEDVVVSTYVSPWAVHHFCFCVSKGVRPFYEARCVGYVGRAQSVWGLLRSGTVGPCPRAAAVGCWDMTLLLAAGCNPRVSRCARQWDRSPGRAQEACE